MRREWLAVCGLAVLGCCSLQAQMLDASQMHDLTEVTAAWRIHFGDGPGLADAGLDDSAWPLLAPKQMLAAIPMQDVTGVNDVWLRLRVEKAGQPLGLSIQATVGLPYEVYANGQRIAESPAWRAQTRSSALPFAIALPQGSKVVVAVHFTTEKTTRFTRSPMLAVEAGPVKGMAANTDLARLENFNVNGLAEYLTALLAVGLGVVAFTLFYAQRSQREYLWLALLMVSGAVYFWMDASITLGAVSLTRLFNSGIVICGFGVEFLSLRFVMAFSKVRNRLPLRVLQGLMVLGPVIFLTASGTAYNHALLVSLGLWTLAVSYCLIDAYRRGRGESGLLLPSFAIFGLANLYQFAAEQYPAQIPYPSNLRVGHVGFGVGESVAVFYIGSLIGIVLLRFVRVSREQQQSAAEIEAARVVQQVLIPEELPRIAGLTIESVYRPAQQVGGDFFQVIAAEDGGALVVLGDVSGKGMQAAMTVSLLVGAVRTEAEHTSLPARLMQMLNRRSYGRGSSFTTCLILHVAQNGEVTAANAGHLAPYVAGREIALEGGLPLGFDLDAEYVETRFILSAGERLTLVTDGVVEATNVRRELFGFERTREVSAGPAAGIAGAAERFAAGAVQADDITVLTVVMG